MARKITKTPNEVLTENLEKDFYALEKGQLKIIDETDKYCFGRISPTNPLYGKETGRGTGRVACIRERGAGLGLNAIFNYLWCQVFGVSEKEKPDPKNITKTNGYYVIYD